MKPLVSILIPAYNAERFISATLESVLAQTWPRTEIIVVDDGSRDGTLAAAKQFEARGVKVVTQQNSGAATARNRAFELSQGDFIQWLDADDLLGRDKIARQMAVVEGCPDKMVLFSSEWGRFLHRPSHAHFEQTALCADQPAVEWLLNKLGKNLHMQPATWLVSRELTLAAGPWDARLTLDDDGEYFCRVILASHGIKFVAGARMYYRHTSSGSLSAVDRSDKKLESLWLSMQAHVRYLRGLEDSARTRMACVTYLGNWLGHFEPARPDIVAGAQKLAQSLGGKIELPRVRTKYMPVENFFGRRAALRAQVFAPNLKMAALRAWDKTMLHLGGGGEI
ncbi:MAG TPA: glycosyltransferase family A protein [Candidatus Sulfotelmatobacter sp.]|jgi:glycosyltransferase involved in cell wall biosynthesis|nr:glycosyltransferase family A protein [Candidatus Sulfotelmatobacter sp.]